MRSQDVVSLRSAAAVRSRCRSIYEAGLAGELEYFTVNHEAIDDAAKAVAAEVGRTYPDGPIPIHGRLNHLRLPDFDGATIAIDGAGDSLIDFMFVSVLLDAGAGHEWGFLDGHAGLTTRSEGLAVASLRAAEAGCFGSGSERWHIDASGLANVDAERLADLMQHRNGNEMAGFDGRVDLIRALGETLMLHGATSVSDLFDSDLGVKKRVITGPELLEWILDRFSDLWPGRLELDGDNLGDTWRHRHAGGVGATTGLVPFHKLSQWLAYSLVEPLAARGIAVSDLGQLTGLAEYRNGGMLLETGAISLRSAPPADPVAPGEAVVVEWRALTVSLLDEIQSIVGTHLPQHRAGLGLGELLEAGTWPLGRRFAFERSASGEPPIRIISDGTVF